MARLRDSDPHNTSGSYERLFGDAALGRLASQVQSTAIRAGSELEQMIMARVNIIEDLDDFLASELMPDGVFVAPKIAIKRSKILNSPDAEPDYLVFHRRKGTQACHVIELKDGHVFDTKKASAERQSMHRFIEFNAQHIQYRVKAHFCAFNQDNATTIREGFKRRISLEEAMTGREFCELLEIDYEEILKARETDQADNVNYYLSQIAANPILTERLRRLLG